MEKDQLGMGNLELDGPINYIEDLGWNRLGLHPNKIMEVKEYREVWRLNLELLLRNPHGKASNKQKLFNFSCF